MPVAAPELDRGIDSIAMTRDGRKTQTTRLASVVAEKAEIADSPAAGLLSRLSIMTWLGLLVSLLLAGEWILYQRGSLP